MKVVLDVSTPPLGHVIVQGSLFINSTSDVTMTATYIEIRGGSLIVAEVVHNSNLNDVCSKLSCSRPHSPALCLCLKVAHNAHNDGKQFHFHPGSLPESNPTTSFVPSLDFHSVVISCRLQDAAIAT
jgi:hypothetical protein